MKRHRINVLIVLTCLFNIFLSVGADISRKKKVQHQTAKQTQFVKKQDVAEYEILFRNNQNTYQSFLDEVPDDCVSYADNPNNPEQSEWVVVLPYEKNFSNDCIIVKQATRIGEFFLYELASPGMTIVSNFVDDDVNMVIMANERIEPGPGRPTIYVSEVDEMAFANKRAKNQRLHERFNIDAAQCRTEPDTSDRGFRSGYFSWGADRLDQRSPTLDGTCCVQNSADGIHIYIVDTGILQHSTFQNPIHYDYSYFYSDPTSVPDCNGHGTHVAGIVGSTVYGVSTGVILHSIQVLDCNGSGSFGTVMSGLLWIYQFGVWGVINMSLGARDSGSPPLRELIQNLINVKKMPVVVSAGNLQEDACASFPASIPEAFTVAATDIQDSRAYFSNFGTCVDIWAPGQTIISCANLTSASFKSGTSMAAPFITGIVAQFMKFYNNPSMSVASLITAIKNAANVNIVKNMKPSANSPNLLAYMGPGSMSSVPVSPPTSPPPTSSPPPVSPPPPPTVSPPPPPTVTPTPIKKNNGNVGRVNLLTIIVLIFVNVLMIKNCS